MRYETGEVCTHRSRGLGAIVGEGPVSVPLTEL